MDKVIYVDSRGTGCGKTTRAINSLTRELEKRFNVNYENTIILTPYTATKNQLLQSNYYKNKTYEIGTWVADGKPHTDRVLVSTYAKFSSLLETGLEINNSLIILDELPTFVQFTAYQPQQGYLLEMLLEDDTNTYYGLTATPELLFKYIDVPEITFVDDTPEAKSNLDAAKGVFVNGGSAYSYVKYLINNKDKTPTAIYVQSATEAVRLYHMYLDAGYKAAYVVSKSNDTFNKRLDDTYSGFMESSTFNGKNINEWIVESGELPPELEVLIFNDAMRDGLSIQDASNRIQRIIIQSADAMTIRQARARIRHDVEQLIIIYNKEGYRPVLESVEDVRGWLSSSRDLEERYKNQSLSILEEESWKVKRNQAYKAGMTFSISRPHRLDLLVHKGKNGLFVNPFMTGLLEYQLDNYLFAVEQVEVVDGWAIDSRIQQTPTQSKTKTQYANGFVDMCKGGIVHVSGNQVCAAARNANKDLHNILSKYLNKKLFKEDKSKLVNELGLIRSNRHAASWSTVKNEIVQSGYQVSDGRGYINGKQSRFVQITRNETKLTR